MDVEPVVVIGASLREAPVNENGLAGAYENVCGSPSRSTERPPTKGRGPGRGEPKLFDLSAMAASQLGLQMGLAQPSRTTHVSPTAGRI